MTDPGLETIVDKKCKTCGAQACHYVADFDQIDDDSGTGIELVRTGYAWYCEEHTRPSYIRK